MTEDAAVQKKARDLAEKTEKIRKLFNLPESETVVQNYSCGLKGKLSLSLPTGKLYITPNYAVWKGMGSALESWPFRRVSDVRKSQGFQDVLELDVTPPPGPGAPPGPATVQLAGWMHSHRDEAYEIIK